MFVRTEIMRSSYLVAVVLALLACAYASEFYSDKYDYIDATDILENSRLRQQYYNCFMDKEPCKTPDAAFFKGNLAEVFATKCKKCTERQKANFDKMADWYTQNRPDDWKAFVEKYINEARKLNAEAE